MTGSPLPIDNGVDLEGFELLVYGRRHQEAVHELLVILRKLKRGSEFAGHVCDDTNRTRLYSRLAAAIGTLIMDPDFEPDQLQLDRLAVEHSTLSAVFRCSVFESPDHLIRQLGIPDPADPDRINFSGYRTIAKLLLAYPLDSGMDIDIAEIFRSAPRMSLPAYLGRIGQLVPLSAQAQARLNSLLALGPFFEEVDINEQLVDPIAEAYFYCSYADAPGKHSVKRSLNILLRRFIERLGLLPAVHGGSIPRDRPTVLVPLERFRADHAMYRCYAPYLQKMRNKFRLVAVGPASELDEVSRQCFDECIPLDDRAISFPDLIARAQAVEPDIVYYPSIGMSPWSIVLSTLRLAPIQVMSLGHPATTHSAEIDYALVSEAMPGNPDLLSETTFVVEGSLSFAERFDAEIPRPNVREHPDVIRVAVPAALMKLNAAFLSSCQAISRMARRPVHLNFFPHTVGMAHFQLARQIRKWIPSAAVHEAADYNDYMRKLAQCDVHLSPFPFGGTNSNIDSMRLGIPIVTLSGSEVHSQTDAGMLRAAGLPEWLIGHDVAEYEAAALRLIENDHERVRMARHLLSVDLNSIFYEPSGSRSVQDFVEAFSFINANHRTIKATGRRIWTIEDRRSFRQT